MTSSIPDDAAGPGDAGGRPSRLGAVQPRSNRAPDRSRPARRGRRLLATAVAACLAISAAACGDSGSEEPATDLAIPTDEQTLEPEVTVEPGPAPEIELLDAGSGEHR